MSDSVSSRTAAHQASLSFTNLQSLLKLMSTESVISSSVVPFSCPQSFLASGSFPVSRIITSGGQSIGASGSASVLPIKIFRVDSFRIDWFDLLAFQGTQESSPTPQLKHQFFGTQPFLLSSSHICVITWKNHSFDCTDFCRQRMSLLFNVLSRFVITFIPRSKCLLISCLWSPSPVILEPN